MRPTCHSLQQQKARVFRRLLYSIMRWGQLLLLVKFSSEGTQWCENKHTSLSTSSDTESKHWCLLHRLCTRKPVPAVYLLLSTTLQALSTSIK